MQEDARNGETHPSQDLDVLLSWWGVTESYEGDNFRMRRRFHPNARDIVFAYPLSTDLESEIVLRVLDQLLRLQKRLRE